MAYTLSDPQQYGKRTRYGTILVPPTTDQCLVFPLNQDTNKFEKNFYSPSLTDGRLTNEQLGHFLENVEKTSKQKQSKLRLLKAYLGYCLFVGVLITVLYSIAVLSDIDDDYEQYQRHPNKHSRNLRHTKNTHHQEDFEDEELFNMFVGWVFMIFGVSFWSIILIIIKKMSQQKALEGVQEVVDKNSQIFASHGLRWNVPAGFPLWIELWKDYKGQNYNFAPNQPQLNPITFNQPIPTIQNPPQTQKYPNLNQVVDQSNYLDFQRDVATRPLLNNQGQRQDNNNYTPPYSNMFMSTPN